jgi:hypothetical protein
MVEQNLFLNKYIQRRILQVQECGLPMQYSCRMGGGDIVGFVGGFPEIEVKLNHDSFNLGPKPEKKYNTISLDNHPMLYKSLLKACGKSHTDIPVFTYDDLCVHVLFINYNSIKFLMPKRKFSD